MARHRGEAASPHTSDLGVRLLFSTMMSMWEPKLLGIWDLADMDAAEGRPKHTVLKAKLTELQDTCRRAGVTVLSSLIDVVKFAVRRASVSSGGDISSSNVLRRDFMMSDVPKN